MALAGRHYLVTGGTGFLGAALVRRLLAEGARVRVLDDDSRGAVGRLADLRGNFEFVKGDVRDPSAVAAAVRGVDSVCHLAFVNGTEFFYSKPELVLEVGVKGMMNVLDACLAHNIPELVLASSSEVYQTPPTVPTAEDAPLSIPDPRNPRYSYAGGKIISELLALNYGRKYFERVVVFRPHNVYGADMGWEHVLPQFALRLHDLEQSQENPLPFPIQGTGQETRAFVYIDDFTDGLVRVIDRGEHLGIYHIGTTEEITIAEAARIVAGAFGRSIRIVPGAAALGGTQRRCPDITKLKALGYQPRVMAAAGIPLLAEWYRRNASRRPRPPAPPAP